MLWKRCYNLKLLAGYSPWHDYASNCICTTKLPWDFLYMGYFVANLLLLNMSNQCGYANIMKYLMVFQRPFIDARLLPKWAYHSAQCNCNVCYLPIGKRLWDRTSKQTIIFTHILQKKNFYSDKTTERLFLHLMKILCEICYIVWMNKWQKYKIKNNFYRIQFSLKLCVFDIAIHINVWQKKHLNW